ncbi:hypothetical protein M9H77_18483 [Catharanthus roseus]|uniref:Uncharacterized protein n=1 Tax=Catharanthus roseus TaxID=4058 RepID=A0ACC0B7L1_CATRO|nr:hypothetical protein M9H77_18483 [Catharanthus roseus]
MESKSGPITRAQRKKLKIHEDNGMVAYMEEALKSKLQGTKQGNKLEEKLAKYLVETTLPPAVAPGSTVASRLLDGQALKTTTYCRHVEATKFSIKVLHQGVNLGKVLARQFKSVVRDVKSLKKGKSSAIMEQRVGDNLGGFC